MKEEIQAMTGLTSLGLLIANKVSAGATELDRKMAFNYILGVAIGALSAKFPDPDPEKKVAEEKEKSPSAPLKDKGEDRPKRKYTRKYKRVGKDLKEAATKLATMGEKKHGGWPKGKKRAKKFDSSIIFPIMVSAAEADAAIRKMERDEKAKLTGAGQ